jgi:hypothetical protein
LSRDSSEFWMNCVHGQTGEIITRTHDNLTFWWRYCSCIDNFGVFCFVRE